MCQAEPGPGEVLVKVETSGLCHTDIHAAHGDWPVKPTLPLIPGHEGVGIVEEVGAGRQHAAVGDRVAMPWLGTACGDCDYCVDGWETLCDKQVNTGYGRDGSLRRVRGRRRGLRRPGPRGRRPARRRPADLRGRHHLQGGQGLRRRPGSARRGVRHRRPRPPRPAVRQDRRRDRRRRRRRRREARTRQGTRRRLRRQRADRGPDRRQSRSWAARTRPSRSRSRPRRSSRPSARCAAAAPWSSWPCRPTTTSSCRSSRPC